MAGNWSPLLNQIHSLPDMLSWGMLSATQWAWDPHPLPLGSWRRPRPTSSNARTPAPRPERWTSAWFRGDRIVRPQ